MTAGIALPRIDVKLDGKLLDDADAAGLDSVLVHQRLSLPAQCELGFREPSGRLGAGDYPSAGAALVVLAQGHDVPLFEGDVTAIEVERGPGGQHRVRIRGYDRSFRLRKRQPLRVHEQVSAGELAERLAGEAGLSVRVHADGPTYATVLQSGPSDLDLLRAVGDEEGLYFTVRGSELHLLTLEGEGDPRELELGVKLLEGRFEANAAPAGRTVRARSWDPRFAAAVPAEAGQPRSGRDVAIRMDPGALGGAGECVRMDEAVEDDTQAEARAQGELDRRTAAEVALDVVAEGDPELRPGARVAVRGIARPFDGTYVVTEADHTVDLERGYVTTVRSTPPAPVSARTDPSVLLGVVSDVADPDALGRIRVTLPGADDAETGWLPVVLPAAGANKGLIALPDVGDRVAVLWVGSVPAQGLVLGGLYGQESPPDAGVEGGAVRRFTFMTPGGQKLVLDDEETRILLETSDGSHVEMSPDGARLHSVTDLTIEAPGRSVTIRGAKIDFESA